MYVEIIPPKGFFEKTRYKLLEDEYVGSHAVPQGFITDGATAPRFAWCLFPPTGRYFTAAVVHDYLLSLEDYTSSKHRWEVANKAFKEALLHLGVNKPTIFTLHTAVLLYSKYKLLKEKFYGLITKY